jgi:hypothetical protein
MLAVLGGLADVERDLIRTRTAEGRERARARGQRTGRQSKLTPAQRREARDGRAAGRDPQGTGGAPCEPRLRGLVFDGPLSLATQFFVEVLRDTMRE